MPITVIGVIIVPLGLYLAVAYPRKLLPLMVFCSVLQAASISGVIGLTPYDFIGSLIAIRYLLTAAYKLNLGAQHATRPLMWFWVWGLISACTLPIIFAGIPVVAPGALEQILSGMTPLHISTSNLSQSAILTINVIAIFEAWRTRVNCWPAFRWGAILATTIVYLQFVAKDRFPYFLLNNNPRYGQAHLNLAMGLNRPSGTFVEPSAAGAYFCGIVCLCLTDYFENRGRVWKCLLALATLLLVGSGAGLGAFAVMLVVIFVQYRPWRSINLRVSRLKMWSALGLCVLLPVLMIAPLAGSLIRNTAGKEGSFSMLVRVSVDLAAFHVLLRTAGAGAGLGSVRASSFLITLLANVGLPGLIFFVLYLKRSGASWITWGILAAMVVGVPDISLSVLWASLILGAVPREAERESSSSSAPLVHSEV